MLYMFNNLNALSRDIVSLEHTLIVTMENVVSTPPDILVSQANDTHKIRPSYCENPMKKERKALPIDVSFRDGLRPHLDPTPRYAVVVAYHVTHVHMLSTHVNAARKPQGRLLAAW